MERRQHNHGGGMSGMDGMDMSEGECTMHMLGNWKSTNICILTSSWHIKTTAQFVGSCIGVFCLVFLIEAIRRWGREWDRYIVRRAVQERLALRRARRQALVASQQQQDENKSAFNSVSTHDQPATPQQQQQQQISAPLSQNRTLAKIESAFFGVPSSASAGAAAVNRTRFRPTVVQQLIRSFVYTTQFAGAYIVMLIAMSFNGYILLAIMLGGFAGDFVSTWDNLSRAMVDDDSADENDLLLFGAPANSGLSGGQVDAVASSKAAELEAEQRALRLGQEHGEGAYGSGACCG
ncbi:hypothetical protein V8E36_007173 [Tilletia maclaganii]